MPRINNYTFYTTALQAHGETPLGLNWHSQEHQQLRFRILLALLPKNLSAFSLGDAGCGFGDFYSYLQEKPKKYLGIDSLEAMQKIAIQKTNSQILLADITQSTLPTMDYYICSGALNILTPFETYLFIANCYKSSKKGFVFNALYGEKESQTYNYLTKKQIQDIATTLHVKKIAYKEGYLESDITVGFFK